MISLWRPVGTSHYITAAPLSLVLWVFILISILVPVSVVWLVRASTRTVYNTGGRYVQHGCT